MSLFKFLQAVVNIICGKSAESHQQQPDYYNQQSQQQPQKPHVSKPQHHGQPTPHHTQAHNQQQQQHYPPKPQQHTTPSPKPHYGGGGKHQDLNQQNQHNEHYMGLRARANEEGDKMSKCFDEAHRAYESGNGARAKELSNEGKAHQRRMEEINQEAGDWIFQKNNEDSKPGEIDLHGLYVKEAIARTDRALEEAKRRGDSEVHLIVGKGLHSPGGAAKLKPAIEDLMRKHQLVAELDHHNSGVLIVQIATGGERGVSSDEITRRLEHSDESCIIM